MFTVPGFSLEAVYGAVPARVADNFTVASAFVGAEKARAIVEATGFPVRRAVEPGTTVFDLMLPAARRALEGVAPDRIGGVVACTFSAPDRFPALAVRLQQELGLPGTVAALDLSLACSGYPYALFVAGQLANATGLRVLLVDGDVQSAQVDADDVNTLLVMSDAATATLVAPGGAGATFDFLSDGAEAEVLRCPATGRIRMNGFGVFRFVAKDVADFLTAFLEKTGSSPDYFVPHQANLYMVRQLAKRLGLGERLIVAGDRYANPGSCSVPLALAAGGFPTAFNGAANLDVLLAAFGAGLSAAAVRLPISSTLRRGVVEL